VAEVGKAGACHQPYVSRTNNGDSHFRLLVECRSNTFRRNALVGEGQGEWDQFGRHQSNLGQIVTAPD
jgi:hypothetical protein